MTGTKWCRDGEEGTFATEGLYSTGQGTSQRGVSSYAELIWSLMLRGEESQVLAG